MSAPNTLLVDDDLVVHPHKNESLSANGQSHAPELPDGMSSDMRDAKLLVIPSPEKRPQPTQPADHALKDATFVENLQDGSYFLAASVAMKQIRAQAALIAKVDVPVLLLGESGVGKEVLARLIHQMSPRAPRPMVKVNCAAIPNDLLESELFGYEAGAFTGARKSKPGKFDLAQRGTILLDEIGEMSSPLQAKLLHVLQDGTYSRLGGGVNLMADARVLAATNVDVKAAIDRGTLREDLYYRLNAFTLSIPPLRDRREEIPMLLAIAMNALANKFGRNPLPVSEKLVKTCLRYHWPGNLRELDNFVKRYLVLEDEALVIDELEMKMRGDGPAPCDHGAPASSGGLKDLARRVKGDAEAKEIQRALDLANWNRRAAATQLNISYKALLYKIKQHHLTPRRTGGVE